MCLGEGKLLQVSSSGAVSWGLSVSMRVSKGTNEGSKVSHCAAL